MKTLAYTAALFSVVTFATLSGHPGAHAQNVHRGDAPGMENYSDETASSSKEDAEVVVPTTVTVSESVVLDEPKIFNMIEDVVFVSDNTMDLTNLHFSVPKGITLTFRAPAVKIARDEASSWPLFDVSGTVIFEAAGSTTALLDGSLADDWGIVQVDDEDGVFLPGVGNIVRYHASGITVSTAEDTGDLGGSYHEDADNHDAEPDQTESTTAPPNPTASDGNPSVSSPKTVLTVGEKLTAEPLVSPTGKSAVWAAKHGSIVFAKEPDEMSDVSGHQNTGGLRTSVLVSADIGKLKRVLRARQALVKEMEEGGFLADKKKTRIAWGWVPFRRQKQKDVERARGHVGEVETTISNRGCVEVSLDGTCVLSKSGPYKWEWVNRFPWRRKKNNDYQLHVKADGMEVRLGEKTVWGITADEIMG